MTTIPRDPRARGRGRGGGGGTPAPAPGPPPAPRTLEARIYNLERRVDFLVSAWERVAFERSEERGTMVRLLTKIHSANSDILMELRSRAPPVPPPPP